MNAFNYFTLGAALGAFAVGLSMLYPLIVARRGYEAQLSAAWTHISELEELSSKKSQEVTDLKAELAKFQIKRPCITCDGTGTSYYGMKCQTCNGTGEFTDKTSMVMLDNNGKPFRYDASREKF